MVESPSGANLPSQRFCLGCCWLQSFKQSHCLPRFADGCSCHMSPQEIEAKTITVYQSKDLSLLTSHFSNCLGIKLSNCPSPSLPSEMPQALCENAMFLRESGNPTKGDKVIKASQICQQIVSCTWGQFNPCDMQSHSVQRLKSK